MSLIDGSFNAAEVEPEVEISPLPEGLYTCAITEAEEKTTKSGTGEYLSLKWQVLEGPFKGRIVFQNLNLRNNNKQAVDIAKAQLSAVCRAINTMQPKSVYELQNKPCVLKIVLKKRKDTNENENRITKWMSIEDAAKDSPQAASTTATDKAPWEK